MHIGKKTIFENSAKTKGQNQQVFSSQQAPVVGKPTSSGSTPLPDSIDQANKPRAFKKLLKIFLGILLLLGLIPLILLVASPNFMNKTGLGVGSVSLTYWGLWEDDKIMQSVISDFERQNPNITVKYTKQDINQYRERLLTRIQQGTGPDIFRFHNTWHSMLSSVLLPLPNDTISKEEFTRNFYPVMQKDLIKNGAIYGIPLEVDTLSLFINTQLFQSAGLSTPVTWNDFINAARAMTVKDIDKKIKTAGAAIGTFNNVIHAPDILSLLFLQNGVDFNNLQASSDRFQGALSFYTSFVIGENNVWDSTLDPSILAFSKGNLGMFFGYSWDYFTIKQLNPNLAFRVVSAPQLPNQNVTLASYWAEGVSSGSKHPKETLLFMKFLAKKDTAEKFYAEASKTRSFGEPYARIDLADRLKTNPDVYTFVAQAPAASSSLFVDSTYDNGINEQLNKYLENAVNFILDNGSTQTAFETFSQGTSQVLQKYGQ